jgi:hypothetical protein
MTVATEHAWIHPLQDEREIIFLLRFNCIFRAYVGRAIVQEVSRQLPIAAARVRAQVRSWGICGVQSGTGAGFLRVLRFPLSILIPPTAPHSSSIVRGWYNRPVSGRRTKWTQSHPTPRNYNLKLGPMLNVHTSSCSDW